MSTPKPTKAVKRWAVRDKSGKIVWVFGRNCNRRTAESWTAKEDGETLVRVPRGEKK